MTTKTLTTYLVYGREDETEREGKTFLVDMQGEANAETPLAAAYEVMREFMEVPHDEGRSRYFGIGDRGVYVVSASAAPEGLNYRVGDAEFPSDAVFEIDSDELEDLYEADLEARAAEEDEEDESPSVDLDVGFHDYDDGLRLMGEGTFNYAGVPSARIGVYRRLPDGHAYGRESTVIIETRRRDVMGADTLRRLVAAA